MKITKIKRKVTGNNYDNLELTAKIEEGESIDDVIIEIDEECRNQLKRIEEKEKYKRKATNNINEVIRMSRTIEQMQAEGKTNIEIYESIRERYSDDNLPF